MNIILATITVLTFIFMIHCTGKIWQIEKFSAFFRIEMDNFFQGDDWKTETFNVSESYDNFNKLMFWNDDFKSCLVKIPKIYK